jgi:4'-phosphopantetheinyl transferase
VSTAYPELTEHSVLIWWCEPVEPCPPVLALLDDAEQARHLRLRRPEDRARHATAHALLRLVLGHLLDREPNRLRLDRTCPQCGGEHGKPRLVAGELEFSLTHGVGLVGVAVARVPVGLDVEAAGRDDSDPTLLEEALAPVEAAELAALAAADRPAAFLRYWTRKEAVVKARGTGLVDPLNEIVVTGSSGTRLPGPNPIRAWDLTPKPGFVAALAAITDRELTIRQLPVGKLPL